MDSLGVDFSADLVNQAEAEALEALDDALRRGFEPPPRQTVSQWADANRVLTKRESPEPGPWRTRRNPPIREIMDALSVDSDVERVVVIKGAQVGGSEVGNNWLGYIMSHPPAAAPTMAVLPTVDMAQRMSRQRLEPLINSVPAILKSVTPKRSRDGGNTLLSKEFANGDGLLVLAGANSAAGLRSMSARWLFPDEIDAYPLDVEGEGAPLELLDARSSTFGRRGKMFIPSTPTVRGESEIEAQWNDTDKRYYFVPCPDCGDLDYLRWDRMKWDEDKPETAAMVCESCGVLIPEHRKPWFLAEENGAKWIPTAEGVPHWRGYHLSALYSPLGWKSWERCVRQFLRARRDEKSGRLDRMKTWVNTVIAETWEERGESLDPSGLLARREHYGAPVPTRDGPCVLTAGVDVQDNRLEVLVMAWARGEESWSIDTRTLWGDPDAPAVWTQLDLYLSQKWATDREGVTLPVSAVCVDSGYKTESVYRYVQPRQARRVWATKGRAGEGLPITKKPTRQKAPTAAGGWVDLFTLGVDTAKGLIYSRLRQTEPGPGYLHFPEAPQFDAEFFDQLTAEKRKTHYVRGRPKRLWVKKRARNEALDMAVLNLAALHILNPTWDALEANLEGREGRPAPPPGIRPGRRGNWVTGWKKD